MLALRRDHSVFLLGVNISPRPLLLDIPTQFTYTHKKPPTKLKPVHTFDGVVHHGAELETST